MYCVVPVMRFDSTPGRGSREILYDFRRVWGVNIALSREV